MDISFALAALYYGMYLLGAGSIGYLLVRLSYPDIRLLDKDAKLGVSAILGFFIMCVSIAVEWVAGHAADFGLGLASYQGLMPVFSCVLVIITFGIMKVYFFVNSPRMLTVGLPIHSASKAAKAMDSPVPFAQAASGQQAFSPFGSNAPKSGAPAAAFASRTVASVVSQPSGLFGFVDLLFKKRGPQTVQKKQELVEIDVPIVQHVAGERQQPAGQASATVQFTSIDLSQQANEDQKRKAAPVKADANVPAPFVSGLQQKVFAKTTEGAAQKPAEKTAAAAKPTFASKAAPFVSGITPDMIAPASYSRQKPSTQKTVAEEDVPKDERSRKDYYDKKINELLSGFPVEDTERKVTPPVAPNAPAAKQAGAFAPAPSAAVAQKPAAPVKSRKELEMESEMMIEDLVPVGSQKPAAPVAAAEESTHRVRPYEQVQQQAERVMSESAPAEPSDSRRRMYARSSSIRVIAPRDVSETDEFADIITDIYSQLKSSSREDSLNNSMMVNVPPSSAEKTQAKSGAAKGKFDDLEGELFGTSKPAASSPASEGGVFDQLSRISAVDGPSKALANDSGLKSSSDMEFVHIGNEAGMGCPTCHQKNSRIVFCPYCGSGMCTNCSPNVQVDMAGFVYSCPKCGEEVHIKKKSAAPSA